MDRKMASEVGPDLKTTIIRVPIALGILLCCTRLLSAGIVYDETIDGDLPHPNSAFVVGFGLPNPNTLRNTVELSSDGFILDIGPGERLVSFTLISYTGSAGATATFTVRDGIDVSDPAIGLASYASFDGNLVGVDFLDHFLVGPLGQGQFLIGFWHDNTPNPTLEFDLVFSCDLTPGRVAWYRDADQDGFGTPNDEVLACEPPSGYVADFTDCDDTDPAVNPGAADICGEDRNCDAAFPDPPAWYRDADADGFGDAGDSTEVCEQPQGFVADNTDCDDTDSGRNPGAIEACDGLDNNCDTVVDEDFSDSDGDGIADCVDNCPTTANADQADGDGNGIGDACEAAPAVQPDAVQPPAGQPDGSCGCGAGSALLMPLMLTGMGWMRRRQAPRR